MSSDPSKALERMNNAVIDIIDAMEAFIGSGQTDDIAAAQSLVKAARVKLQDARKELLRPD